MPSRASPERPEAFTGLVNIGIAIPRELLKGRARRGVEGPARNSPFPVRMEGATWY